MRIKNYNKYINLLKDQISTMKEANLLDDTRAESIRRNNDLITYFENKIKEMTNEIIGDTIKPGMGNSEDA